MADPPSKLAALTDAGGPAPRWLENPPASDGRNVVINDTDHYAPGRGDAL